LSESPLLQIKDLRVNYHVYGGTLHVLDGINMSVYPGEKIGLVGETGCGKTTTMKSALGVLPSPPGEIAGGEIVYKGKNILAYGRRQMSAIRGREMTMIFQDPMAALNPVFTVAQQFAPVLQHAAAGHLSRREIAEKSVRALENVALADPKRLQKAYPAQLSGGMRQRVCIGMALATNPRLLIADEPGTALDVTIQAQVLALINDLVEKLGTSIILITHSLGVVREMADRVYVMYAGNIVEMAPTRRLFTNPRHPYTQGLMEAVPRLSGGGLASSIAGRIPDYQKPPSGCRFHPRCPRAMDICRQQKPPAVTVEEGHEVACFLYSNTGDGNA
jgi:peptide/nickel transport system ATP-binding protein